MNNELYKKRGTNSAPAQNQSVRNFPGSGNKYYSIKRSYEEDVSPAPKRHASILNFDHPQYHPTHPNIDENLRRIMVQRSPVEQSTEQPRRRSANDRLKKIYQDNKLLRENDTNDSPEERKGYNKVSPNNSLRNSGDFKTPSPSEASSTKLLKGSIEHKSKSYGLEENYNSETSSAKQLKDGMAHITRPYHVEERKLTLQNRIKNIQTNPYNVEEKRRYNVSPRDNRTVEDPLQTVSPILPNTTKQYNRGKNTPSPKDSSRNNRTNFKTTCAQVSPGKQKNGFAKPSSLEERLRNIRQDPTLLDRNLTNAMEKSPKPHYSTDKNNTYIRDGYNRSSPCTATVTSFINTKSPAGNEMTEISGRLTSPSAEPYRSPASCNNSLERSNSSNNITLEDDSMDWSYSDEREVILSLQELRNSNDNKNIKPKTLFQEIVAKELSDVPNNTTILKENYVVVDTNIFISHLNIVKELMKIKLNVSGVSDLFIFVPWMVIQELDYIKDGRTDGKLKKKAQTAVLFINDSLCTKKQMKGQSVRDASKQNFHSNIADDGILYCCLQIRDRHNRPILLSNDVNLRNKAIMNNIVTYRHDQILKAMDPYGLCTGSNKDTQGSVKSDIGSEINKLEKVKSHISQLCSFIIAKEMNKSYGETWKKMGGLRKEPPWTVEECIDLFKKYWMPVFQMNLANYGMLIIDKLKNYLNFQNGQITNVDKFVTYCFELCIVLKNGYGCYFSTIQNCIESIHDSELH